MIAPGWYADNNGQMRWWDGQQWGALQHAAPVQSAPAAPVQAQYAGRTANQMPVSYVRQQKGHSLIKHLMLGWVALYIPTIYYMVSPNHYFHA